MKKLAIIGASYLQEPLITKAKEMGIETHVFAWAVGDVGEKLADRFYPISIIEKERILKTCREIGIDGICSIASDLAMVTVNYVANNMGLVSNSLESTEKSTNKHKMRNAFEANGDPSPKSIEVDENTDVSSLQLSFPVIVKPTDRSGSRGIYKLNDGNGLKSAIDSATRQSFEKKALVEEFAEGREYSVEFVSFEGKHKFLAITQKYTTGAPNFIETGHLQPALLDSKSVERVKDVVRHALDTLGIRFGASHSEVKIDDNGNIRIIEIGGRMGGDFIGSNLVKLSTGFDFVRAVISIALGEKPDGFDDCLCGNIGAAAVRFVFSDKDVDVLNRIKKEHPEYLVSYEVRPCEGEVTDSSSRFGYYLLKAENTKDLVIYLP